MAFTIISNNTFRNRILKLLTKTKKKKLVKLNLQQSFPKVSSWVGRGEEPKRKGGGGEKSMGGREVECQK